MEINIEGKNRLLFLLPGYFQVNKGGVYTPCALGLTDTALYIYNDYYPNAINKDNFKYKVLFKYDLDNIKIVLHEVINANKDLDYYDRLNIIVNNIDSSFFFYTNKCDYNLVDMMLRKMNKNGVKTISRKIKDPTSF